MRATPRGEGRATLNPIGSSSTHGPLRTTRTCYNESILEIYPYIANALGALCVQWFETAAPSASLAVARVDGGQNVIGCGMSDSTEIVERDKRNGRFVTGGKPGPGRAVGSRNKLTESFAVDLKRA